MLFHLVDEMLRLDVGVLGTQRPAVDILVRMDRHDVVLDALRGGGGKIAVDRIVVAPVEVVRRSVRFAESGRRKAAFGERPLHAFHARLDALEMLAEADLARPRFLLVPERPNVVVGLTLQGAAVRRRLEKLQQLRRDLFNAVKPAAYVGDLAEAHLRREGSNQRDFVCRWMDIVAYAEFPDERCHMGGHRFAVLPSVCRSPAPFHELLREMRRAGYAFVPSVVGVKLRRRMLVRERFLYDKAGVVRPALFLPAFERGVVDPDDEQPIAQAIRIDIQRQHSVATETEFL